MAQVCSKCTRPNPDEAAYCYYDGHPFAAAAVRSGAVDVGAQRFASPFVFPAGKECRSFDELAMYCWQHWEQAQEVLQKGMLEPFLGRLGRVDLATAARQAAQFPDKSRGLDQLLGKLPSKVLGPAKLHPDRDEFKLGQLKIGDNRTIKLQLKNDGMRLLHGTIACENCVWLTVGDGSGVSSKLFAFTDQLTIPLQVHGERLRAGSKPLEAQVVVESNGGNVTISVKAEVPAAPFPSGALAGALTPRQIAEKAKASPREAATLFEKGAVAGWYKENGWDYPVKIPAASGIAGIQQFFEALGLTSAPKVKIHPTGLKLKARPGAKLEHNLEVSTEEKRAVWAHAITDQPWLQVTKVSDGKSAVLKVEIPKVPDRPGEVLRGKVTVLSNGRQRFVVPVFLAIAGPVKSKKATPMPARPAAKEKKDEPEAAEVMEIVEGDDIVEIVEAVEAPVQPVEIVDVIEEVDEAAEVEIIDVPAEVSESHAEPSPAPAPRRKKETPGAAEDGANPFAFEEEEPAVVKKRKHDDSVFSKLFGWGKKNE